MSAKRKKKVFKSGKFLDCSAFRFENVGEIQTLQNIKICFCLSFFSNLIQFHSTENILIDPHLR